MDEVRPLLEECEESKKGGWKRGGAGVEESRRDEEDVIEWKTKKEGKETLRYGWGKILMTLWGVEVGEDGVGIDEETEETEEDDNTNQNNIPC